MSVMTRSRPAATRKRRRLYAVLAGMTMLGVATALVLTAFRDNIVFFYGPSDVVGKSFGPARTLRLGGLVAEGSVKLLADGTTTEFAITDLKNTVQVRYTGLLPDLFREGQGVVSEGTMRPDGVFVAREVLAKHDETYMPREVADALKRAGRWNETEGGKGATQ